MECHRPTDRGQSFKGRLAAAPVFDGPAVGGDVSDLYDRLEEIQGMTRVLGGDVERLARTLGDRSPVAETSDEQYGLRRAYVRAIFALIEATIEQHRRLLLDLCARSLVSLDPLSIEALSERTPFVEDNGALSSRERFLALRPKLRLLYRLAGEGLGELLALQYGDAGYQQFGKAVAVRDRITHPKSFDDCHVEGEDLDVVDAGHDWFRKVANEFVRVARAQRGRASW